MALINRKAPTTAIFSVKEFCKRNPTFTQSSLRWLIFNIEKKGNGFEKVVRRIGRRILINEPDFFEWLDAQKHQGPHHKETTKDI